MATARHSSALLIRLLVLTTALTVCSAKPLPAANGNLPAEISDAAFWKMVGDFSEAGGSFTSDNLVSNENTFQSVVPGLKAATQPGGVYIGVGPEQNFTYIAALQSHIAFVVDIRRENMLQHLLYKAIFDLSEDRADFLALLFSRKRPEGVGASTGAAELLGAFRNKNWDKDLYWNNLDRIFADLTSRHHFTLTQKDKDGIEKIYYAFFDEAANLSYGYQVGGVGPTPAYADLMASTDGNGRNWSYLANEDNFRFLKDMERKNLIVPIVGDFAGPKAIRAIAVYLSQYGASITAFYTSNVERYLFEDNTWKAFYANVEKLPLTPDSVFIRAWLTPRPSYSRRNQLAIRSQTSLSSIVMFLKAVKSGEVDSYEQLNVFGRQ